jgi:hypothetical protein
MVIKFVVEAVHLRFCKSVLGVSKQTTNICVLSELGRLPILYNIILSIVKFIAHKVR